jgi:hypothetical protein
MVGAGAWVAAKEIVNRGQAFFDRGNSIVLTLDQLAHAAKARDWERLAAFFAADYHGETLGLGSLNLQDSRNGVQRFTMRPDGAARDRSAAIAEWDSYLGSFASIETAEFHLHQLDEWSSAQNIRAIVRVEVIGQPRGAPTSGMDRAYLRVALASSFDGLKITGASLIEGERVISGRPQFREVGAQAGIDMLNRYYPAFLSTASRA